MFPAELLCDNNSCGGASGADGAGRKVRIFLVSSIPAISTSTHTHTHKGIVIAIERKRERERKSEQTKMTVPTRHVEDIVLRGLVAGEQEDLGFGERGQRRFGFRECLQEFDAFAGTRKVQKVVNLVFRGLRRLWGHCCDGGDGNVGGTWRGASVQNPRGLMFGGVVGWPALTG